MILILLIGDAGKDARGIYDFWALLLYCCIQHEFMIHIILLFNLLSTIHLC